MDWSHQSWRMSHLLPPNRRRSPGRIAALVVALLVAALFVPSAPASPATAASEPVAVVIRGTDRVPELVASLGGTLTAELPLSGGYAATVPADLVDTLVDSDVVAAVTPDASVRWTTDEACWDDGSTALSATELAFILQ